MAGKWCWWMPVAAWAVAAAAAPAQRGPEGLYVADMREMASGLDLKADGSFRWALSYGALDMTAEGRWRAEADGTIVLDTEPPVRPPRVELLGSGRERAPALVVRIEDARGATPPYLDVEASYASGEPGYAHLEEDAYRFERDRRRIAAVRVGSRIFGFWSEAFPVPADANVMRFRFDPGDLGRADFRGTRAAADGEGLLLPVLGEPLRYRRLTPEEQAEYDGMIADIAAEAGAAGAMDEGGTDSYLAIEAVAVGPVEVALGEPLDGAVERAMPAMGAGMYATTGPVESLRWRIGDAAIDFGRIGGERTTYLAIGTGAGGAVESLAFSYPDRPVTAAEAIERAAALERQLRGLGFTPRPDAEPAGASSAALDDARGAGTIELFALEAGDLLATVVAENPARLSEREGEPNASAGEAGREWLLNVTLARSPDLRATAAAESAGLEGDALSWARCADQDAAFPREVAIAGCTALIESGRLAPEDAATPYFNRGNLWSDEGQPERAIADYDEAIRIDPDFAMAYWGRGAAYGALGDFARALADTREAARREPDDADVLNHLCWYLALNDEALDEARAACDASLALRPGDPDTLDSRAMVGMRQGRFADAWADYDAALALDPERAVIRYGRGVAALRLGREAEGRADIERALAQSPAVAATWARYGITP